MKLRLSYISHIWAETDGLAKTWLGSARVAL